LKEESTRRAALLRTLGTVVAIALLVYVLREQGWDEIVAAVKQIDPWRLGAALLLMAISRLAVAERWHVLLRSGGIQIAPDKSFQITFAGLFASNFLPTTIGGDVIRLAGALRLRCDAAVSAASLVADRLVGMAGMVMVVPFGLPRFLEIRDLRSLISLTGAAPFALAASPYGKLLGKAWERGRGLLQRLLAALGLWTRQPRALLLALIFTWVHMLCLFGALELFFTGMGESISFGLIGGLYSIVYFVTLIPISINGFGLQEISMTLVFSRLGEASLASSLTAALLFRTTMMIASLPGALFVPGLIAYSRQRSELGGSTINE